jgi:hypothetical protein
MLHRRECVYFFERVVLQTKLEKGEAGTLASSVGKSSGKVDSILKYLWFPEDAPRSFLGADKILPGGDLRSSWSL